jgi:hypothetical protein
MTLHLRIYIVWISVVLPTFRKYISPPSSGLNCVGLIIFGFGPRDPRGEGEGLMGIAAGKYYQNGPFQGPQTHHSAIGCCCCQVVTYPSNHQLVCSKTSPVGTSIFRTDLFCVCVYYLLRLETFPKQEFNDSSPPPVGCGLQKSKS